MITIDIRPIILFCIMTVAGCGETVTSSKTGSEGWHDVFLELCTRDVIVGLVVYQDGLPLSASDREIIGPDTRWIGSFQSGSIIAIDITLDNGKRIDSNSVVLVDDISFLIGCDE